MDLMQQIDINQMLIAAMTLTVAGVIGFWCKDVPMKIWEFIKRQFTTTVYITSTHISFYKLMEYLHTNYKNTNFRNFKVTNGKWGEDDITTIGIGYGYHFIKFNEAILFIRLDRHESNGTNVDKETITVTKLGRSRTTFNSFFDAITVDKENENMLQLYRMNDYWCPINQIPKRNLDTIFLDQSIKDDILNTFDTFISSEKWYLDNGIPYHLGILLHSKPGNGKSSLIKAIASHYNYDIYYMPSHQLHKIDECLNRVSKKSIVVLEDIDCEKIVHHRELPPTKMPNTVGGPNSTDNARSTINDVLSLVSFSDVLNALDGICSAHGRILIMTTNHPEKLDRALLRPGRVDRMFEIGFVNQETFAQFTQRFFGRVEENFEVKDELSCATLQSLILQKKSYEEILEFARKTV